MTSTSWRAARQADLWIIAARGEKLFALLATATTFAGIVAVVLAVRLFRDELDPAEDVDLPIIEGRMTNRNALPASTGAFFAGVPLLIALAAFGDDTANPAQIPCGHPPRRPQPGRRSGLARTRFRGNRHCRPLRGAEGF